MSSSGLGQPVRTHGTPHEQETALNASGKLISACEQHRPLGVLLAFGLSKRPVRVSVVYFDATRLWLRINRKLLCAHATGRAYLRVSFREFGSIRGWGHYEVVSQAHEAGLLKFSLQNSRGAPQRLLAQYALRHGATEQLTPKMLRQRRFGPFDASPCLRFELLKETRDWRQVDELRFRVFGASNLLKKGQNAPQDTRDARDAHSAILLARLRNRLVASMRVYKMSSNDLFEFEAWLKTPAALPSKDQSVELGRAAIDADFRNAGLPTALLRLTAKYVMQCNRRYLVLSTMSSLLPLYRYFGFQDTGHTFDYPAKDAVKGHVLVADLQALWRGDVGNPLIWFALFGGISLQDAQGRYAPRTTKEALRVKILQKIEVVSQATDATLVLHRYHKQRVARG